MSELVRMVINGHVIELSPEAEAVVRRVVRQRDTSRAALARLLTVHRSKKVWWRAVPRVDDDDYEIGGDDVPRAKVRGQRDPDRDGAERAKE